MIPKNWLLNEKFIPEVLAAVDEYLAKPNWDTEVTLSATKNKSLQLLLTALNGLAKKGVALRAEVEEVLEAHTCDKMALLENATEIYDGEK